MNHIDLLVVAFLLFGGWLGSLKGRVKSFIDFAGSILGIGVAFLYGTALAPLWTRMLKEAGRHFDLALPWATTASTNASWQQSAFTWLNELLWPGSMKQWIAEAWDKLPLGSSVADWYRVVEDAFVQGLGNICAFLTMMVLVKLVITLLAGFTMSWAIEHQDKSRSFGFCVGLVQSATLVFIIMALMIPLLALTEQTSILSVLRTSYVFRFVQVMMLRLSVT